MPRFWIVMLLFTLVTLSCGGVVTTPPSETIPTSVAAGTAERALLQNAPAIMITEPASSAAYTMGEEVTIVSDIATVDEVLRVELLVDGEITIITNTPTRQTAQLVQATQTWVARQVGAFIIRTRAYLSDDEFLISDPIAIEINPVGSDTATPNLPPPTVPPPTTPTPTPPFSHLIVRTATGLAVWDSSLDDRQYLGTLEAGTTAQILGQYQTEDIAWWEISYPQSESGVGWVLQSSNLATTHIIAPIRQADVPTSTPIAPPAIPTPDYAYLSITAVEQLDIHSGPSTRYLVVGQLNRGDAARITGRNDIGAGPWWQIDDPPGWVLANPDYSVTYNAELVDVVTAPPTPILPTPTPFPTALPEAEIVFTADTNNIQRGECVTIFWDTSQVRAVYYNGLGVPGEEQERRECPPFSTTYSLRVVKEDGSSEVRYIRINVSDDLEIPFRNTEIGINEGVDMDDAGWVNRTEGDDFWYDGEYLLKWDADNELQFANVADRSTMENLSTLTRDDCLWYLGRTDRNRIRASTSRMLCFRTDDGRLGKLRFRYVESTHIEIQWYLWD